MDETLRNHFDQLLEDELNRLPQHLHDLLEEAPLLVEDHPSPQMLSLLNMQDPGALCGLYYGIPETKKSVDIAAQMPEYIFLFREGICRLSGCHAVGQNTAELKRQIHITLLHEIGHHFGLSEDDLTDVGYG